MAQLGVKRTKFMLFAVGGAVLHPRSQAGITIQLLHFLRNAGFALGDKFNNTTCKASQASDILGAVACSDTAAILIEIPINP